MNLFENLQKMKEYNEDSSFGCQIKKFKFKCRKCGKEFIDKYDYPLPIDCGAAVYCPDCNGVASIINKTPIEESIDDYISLEDFTYYLFKEIQKNYNVDIDDLQMDEDSYPERINFNFNILTNNSKLAYKIKEYVKEFVKSRDYDTWRSDSVKCIYHSSNNDLYNKDYYNISVNAPINSLEEFDNKMEESIDEDVDLPDYDMLKRDVDYLAHMVPMDVDTMMIYNQIRVIDSAFDNNNISESQYNELMQIMNKIKNKKFGESVKENVEEDSGLKVCRHCLDAIISREGRQNVVNTYTNYDWDEDAEPLICDWCEDETDELYEIDNAK